MEESAFTKSLPVHHRCHPGAGRPEACPAPSGRGLKTHESTRKLARRVEHGTARIVTATVSQTADRWYVSFTREVQRRLPTSNGRDDVVGVDAGIRHLAVLSTATIITNPRHLARVLADAGLAEPRRQLAYKTTWHGSRPRLADRVYPSSKTCSGCGWVNAELALAERTFICEVCGLQLDRDLNAARNLARIAEHVAQSGWETQNARGADRKPQATGQAATKREPSSPLLQRA
jgi:transposase